MQTKIANFTFYKIKLQSIKNIALLLFLSCIPLLTKAQFYTGSSIEFGQNRVQYHSFFWQYYHFEEFKVYFYAGGKEHAEYVAKSAHKFQQELEEMMDYNLMEELEFIVFNSQSEFKESNIGLRNDGSTNIGGVTTVEGDKIFIYYEGDHDKLDRQIRSGIAKVMAFKMMYGDNWREALKNSSLITLPKWYIDGYLAYMQGDWNTELDNELKSLLRGKEFKSIHHLTGSDARLVGHGIWNYIADVYGEKMIPNILFMTRLSKNVESGFLYVLGTSLPGLSKDFKAYYNARYDEDLKGKLDPNEKELVFKTKKKYQYYNFSISPDGKYASFVTNQLGQYKVWLYDIKEDKLRKIAKGNHKLDRLPDYTYPITAWHPTSKVLSFLEEKKGGILLNIYDVESKKKTPRPIAKLTKVLSMNYNTDGKKLIMSAVQNGQTDIFLYNIIGGNKIQLTDDIFDDLHPSFIDNDTKVIFSSNRLDDTIRKNVEIKAYSKELDIYILDIDKPTRPLQRITKTPYFSETHGQQYDAEHYTFLSNENGITNRFIAYYDSTINFIDTAVHYRYFSVTDRMSNYPANVKGLKVNTKTNSYSMLMKKEEKYHFYLGDISKDMAYEELVHPTKFMQDKLRLNNVSLAILTDSELIDEKSDSNAVNINDYQFLDDEVKKEFGPDKELLEDGTIVSVDTTQAPVVAFELPRQKLYKTNYANDFVVSQFDNSFLNQTYQRLSPGGYSNPGFNGIVKLGLIDVFEDYRIIGGFRYPLNFRNTEYMLSFENLKNRLDKKYLGTRRAYDEVIGDETRKVETYELKYNIKYPFSEVASVRLTTGLRYDKRTVLSVDDFTLGADNLNNTFGTVKLEYVYDVSRKVMTNVLDGSRFKMWGEFMNEFTQGRTDFFTFGFDYRHYQKIHRSISFASRVAGSTSLGSQRLVYFMGGVDNWIGAKFDQSVQISPEENYQFQTVATPMRGFHQNARNGNSFFVVNNELKVPVFNYFAKNPIRSEFLNNFMIISFLDVGTAWTGLNPYDLENSFNTTIVAGKNYEVIIENQKEPIIYGFGGGLRSKLFGYYIKWDLAWGVDDGVLLKPLNHFSIALDF